MFRSAVLQNDTQLAQLHQILQTEISACNGIILAQTAYHLEVKEKKLEDAIDAYKKAKILLEYWIAHISKKKYILNSIFQNVLVLNHECQARKTYLENNLVMEKNL